MKQISTTSFSACIKLCNSDVIPTFIDYSFAVRMCNVIIINCNLWASIDTRTSRSLTLTQIHTKYHYSTFIRSFSPTTALSSVRLFFAACMHDSRGHEEREKKRKEKLQWTRKWITIARSSLLSLCIDIFFAVEKRKKSFRIRKNERRNLNTVVEVFRHWEIFSMILFCADYSAYYAIVQQFAIFNFSGEIAMPSRKFQCSGKLKSIKFRTIAPFTRTITLTSVRIALKTIGKSKKILHKPSASSRISTFLQSFWDHYGRSSGSWVSSDRILSVSRARDKCDTACPHD